MAGRTLRAAACDVVLSVCSCSVARRLGAQWTFALATLATLAACPTTARADVDKARAVFTEGIRLFKKGDWEGARRLFREADAEHHAPAIVYNLGLAEEKLGHPQAAVDALESYIGEAGDAGEFSPAAATAIAQIKARSTRLRLDTHPGGAKLFVDGSVLSEPAPANVLVGAGHHVIVADGGNWRSERDVEVPGTGDVLSVVLENENENENDGKSKSVSPAPPGIPISRVEPAAETDRPPVQPARAVDGAPDGLMWGAAFAIAPAYLLGVTTPNVSNSDSGYSIVAGPLLEIGYALTDRFEFLGRGFAGMGPDGKPSYAYTLGPGLSYRVADRLWVGAVFIAGQLETRAHGARYGTDQVFGATLEASIVLVKKPAGEWIAGAQPSVLLTALRNDNTTIFVPLTFGYRAY